MSFRFLSISCLVLSFLLGGSALECGPDAGGAVCEEGLCCRKWGWCGATSAYCGDDCISQCDGGSGGGGEGGGGGSGGGTSGSGGISDIISESTFEAMLLHRTDPACQGSFYTYDAFISAAEAFPSFGTTGDEATRKKEIAAFFGQTSHETTGGWPTAPDGPYAWGYCFVTEISPGSSYCDPNYPCPKQYYGRGPIQLSWNYNYIQCGDALGLDLINNPDLLETDPVISFKSAIWFWMTAQSPKPSCHDVIIGVWEPSPDDVSASRLPGYGLTINIINGGLECGHGGPDSRVEDRIGFYTNFTAKLGTEPGDNLDCYSQTPFGSGLLGLPVTM